MTRLGADQPFGAVAADGVRLGFESERDPEVLGIALEVLDVLFPRGIDRERPRDPLSREAAVPARDVEVKAVVPRSPAGTYAVAALEDDGVDLFLQQHGCRPQTGVAGPYDDCLVEFDGSGLPQ